MIITGRRKEALEKAAQELGVAFYLADQSRVSDVEALVQHVQKAFGQLDILFINAGVLGQFSIEQATEEMYDYIMGINLKGAYFTLSRFIPVLKDGASVVFLSSNTASMTTPGISIYASSKAALNSIVRTAALELADRKIRVNAVSPGPTETEVMNKLGYDGKKLDDIKDWILERVPLRKMGTAENVGKMVAFLCSDAADFITGSEVLMDGGMVLA